LWVLLVAWRGAAHLVCMTTPTPLSLTSPDLPPLLDIRELSAYLGVPVSTIYDWRSRGVGPRAYRFGKHLKFAIPDVTEWIEAQRDPAPIARPAPTQLSTTRQDHPKTARSLRTIRLQGFAATAVQRRLNQLNTIDPDALLFCSRERTPLTTNNVRRQLRHVMNLAGIEGVTPHKFRRTVATTTNERAGVELASQLLGHTDPAIRIKHYIRRNETVDPATAGLLDKAFG